MQSKIRGKMIFIAKKPSNLVLPTKSPWIVNREYFISPHKIIINKRINTR
jgi:hypothetical protein